MWIVDRDTKDVEIRVLIADGYERRQPADDGWLHSDATGIGLRPHDQGKLEMVMIGDESTRAELPEP